MNEKVMKFENKSLYNPIGMSAGFYNYQFEDCKLQFEMNEVGIEPTHITWNEYSKRAGVKINIEVVDNGWVVKSSGTSMICSDIGDVRDLIEKLSTEITEHQMAYDPELHKFENLDEIATEVYDNYQA